MYPILEKDNFHVCRPYVLHTGLISCPEMRLSQAEVDALQQSIIAAIAKETVKCSA